MTTRPEPPRPEVLAALERVDALVQLFEEHPDASVQAAVFDLLRSVDALHRGPLQRLAAFLHSHDLLADALADADIALLFDLYNSEEEDGAEQPTRPEHRPARHSTLSPAVIPASTVIHQTRLQREARRNPQTS